MEAYVVNKYVLSVPAGWSYTAQADGPFVQYYERPDNRQGLTVENRPLPPKMTSADYMHAAVGIIRRKHDSVVGPTSTTTLDGKAASLHQFFFTADGFTWYALLVVAAHHRIGTFLAFVSATGDEQGDRALFDKIRPSFVQRGHA